MKNKYLILITLLILLFSCISQEANIEEDLIQNEADELETEDDLFIPIDSISVETLMTELPYNEEVNIFGQIKDLGMIDSTAFFLTYELSEVKVWFDMMVNDDESQEPWVDVSNFESGDWVIVTGTLKDSGEYVLRNSFWATSISDSEEF